MHPYRSHTCGALRREHAGETVRLSGWIHRKRDHGNLLFVDLRDHYGLTQTVIDSASPLFAQLDRLRVESVITVTGQVLERSPDTVNTKLPTGEVELRIAELHVVSEAKVLPLQVASDQDEGEDVRLRHRYLDLRRDKMQHNIALRCDVISALRASMQARGFREFQTPILTASSPEGARDFLVPARLHPGKFYALPQAPQQFKQLVMMAGFDRYFQIAPCFRDEDARADRSPGEFYQLDIELSFCTQEDVFEAVEPVMHEIFTRFGGDWSVTDMPFPRIPYDEAMLKYGTDKPDLRNPLEICDVTEVFQRDDVTFKAFKKVVAAGGVVRAIPAPGAANRPRSFFDKLNDWAREQGKAGLGYIVFEAGSGKGPIAKFVPDEAQARLRELADLGDGDAVFFVCDQPAAAAEFAGVARTKLGQEMDLIEGGQYRFCWIVDFPMYEIEEETGALAFSHNPFSMPQGGLDALQTAADPTTIKAYQYDIVCNGVELSSGAIRNHDPEIMHKAFALAGYSAEELEQRFAGMLEAMRFGAPPHGGIAPGVERIVMLLADAHNIREVVPFPMNQKAEDLLMGAPAPVEDKRLKELSIKLDLPKKKGRGGSGGDGQAAGAGRGEAGSDSAAAGPAG